MIAFSIEKSISINPLSTNPTKLSNTLKQYMNLVSALVKWFSNHILLSSDNDDVKSLEDTWKRVKKLSY